MHPLTAANGIPLPKRQQEVLRSVLTLCEARRGEWLCGSDIWPHPDQWSQARRAMIGWLADIGALTVQNIEVRREHRRVMFCLPAAADPAPTIEGSRGRASEWQGDEDGAQRAEGGGQTAEENNPV